MGCGCGKKLDKSKLLTETVFPGNSEGMTRVKLSDSPALMNIFSGNREAAEPDAKRSEPE